MNYLRHRKQLKKFDDVCPFCSNSEDVAHLFLHGQRATDIWAAVGVHSPSLTDIEQILAVAPPPRSALGSPRVRSIVLTAVLWNILNCGDAKMLKERLEAWVSHFDVISNV